MELGLLPADTTIPSGRKKKKARPSSSSSRHRDYGPRKRHKQQQQQQHSESNNNDDHDEDNDEDDREEEETSEADAAASLLFMGSGKSVSKPANASVVKTNLAQQKNSNDNNDDDDEKDEESEEEEEDDGPPLVPMDAETTLDVYSPILPAAVTRKEATLPSTVHWDPHSPNGRKIGWKVKIENTARRDAAAGWIDGRVVRYDPHTHKHKIEFSTTKITTASSDNINNKGKKKQHCWIWLRNEQHNIQLASRMVWAHVKGYAWWPGLVMESNADQAKTKEGYVLIEFFVTGEISCLRDTLESVRPFDPQVIDAVVAKHRKKRNQAAYQAAMDEYAAIQTTRNQAALYYAKAALDMACYYAPGKNVASSNNNNNISGPNGPALIGKRIQIFRPDIDYPYGDTVIGKVRQYSIVQKKWLISFELSEKQNNRTKYPPAWINVYSKEHVLKVLPPVAIAAAAVEAHKGGKASPFSGDAENQTNNCEELVPFLFGFEPLIASSKKEATIDNGSNDHLNATKEMLDLLNTRCKGCVEYLKTTSTTTASSAVDQIVTCDVCHGSFHLNCLDPPLTVEAWQRMWKAGPLSFTCVRCTPCRGCYNKDISFGSHSHPNPPPTLTLPNTDSIGSKLDLCSMCKVHYDADRFCSNCAHIWDDKKFAMIRRQMEHGSTNGRKRKGASSRDAIVVEDSGSQLVFGYFEGDEEWPLDTKFDPVAFDPETSEWGFTEDEMLVCDNCNVWVHAGCSGVTEDEYEVTSNGDHPIYSKEFLCRMCCRKRCTDLIEGMQYEDKKGLFAAPVSEKVVPNYLDLIKEPMDLKTMYERASVDEYINYVWVRELFELMVLNALTFNRYVSATAPMFHFLWCWLLGLLTSYLFNLSTRTFGARLSGFIMTQ